MSFRLGSRIIVRQAHVALKEDTVGMTESLMSGIGPINVVRVGIVGLASRGFDYVRSLMDLDNVEIRALADIDEDRVGHAQQWLEELGRPRPVGYARSERAFERLCGQEDLDLVITATPWEWHMPVCVAAMKNGKHAATEVPAAVTLDECWELVETAEKYARHCVMLENCCYFEIVLTIMNMIHRGLFGELLHCEAGYQHDLRHLQFNERGALSWRGRHAATRNGNLYPTHSIGPIAHWMNINRGDRFEYLVSMSTKSRGLQVYAEEMFGADHPAAQKEFALGDVNTTLIRTVNGLTVTWYYDTSLPRPYDLIHRIGGIRGIRGARWIGSISKGSRS